LTAAEADNFWWSVDLEAGTGAAAEEVLANLVDLSGSLGAEFLGGEGKTDKQILRAFYPASRDISYWLDILSGLAANFSGVRVRSHSKTENRPWQTESLDAFPPLGVGVGLVVMAPWFKGGEPAGKIPLYIHPGSAFGTGYHESTQIALSLLERFLEKGDVIVDIGTGSGILFIAALKLGAARAVARDLDPAALSEASRNMELNGLPPDLCDLRAGDLLDGVGDKADILTANILLDPNLRLLREAEGALKPSGVAVFSGITVKERPAFLSALPGAGAELIAELSEKSWWGCAVQFA
jgi:ribosomal protein L11 methyltransferase